MNPTMNRQEHKTTLTDPSSMMISPQLDNLILRPNLKPETACCGQSSPYTTSNNGLNSPLSVENPFIGWLSRIKSILSDFSNL